MGAAAVLAFSLGYIPYHVYARSGLARTIALRRDLAALQARNADLRAENARLLREAEALRSDPGAIERVARRDLGWVRPGEIIFQVDARATAAAGPPAPPAGRLAQAPAPAPPEPAVGTP